MQESLKNFFFLLPQLTDRCKNMAAVATNYDGVRQKKKQVQWNVEMTYLRVADAKSESDGCGVCPFVELTAAVRFHHQHFRQPIPWLQRLRRLHHHPSLGQLSIPATRPSTRHRHPTGPTLQGCTVVVHPPTTNPTTTRPDTISRCL